MIMYSVLPSTKVPIYIHPKIKFLILYSITSIKANSNAITKLSSTNNLTYNTTSLKLNQPTSQQINKQQTVLYTYNALLGLKWLNIYEVKTVIKCIP